MSSWGWEIPWSRVPRVVRGSSTSFRLRKPLIDVDLGFPPNYYLIFLIPANCPTLISLTERVQFPGLWP